MSFMKGNIICRALKFYLGEDVQTTKVSITELDIFNLAFWGPNWNLGQI